ncbi:MAG: penicillin-binding transpeptidase domain-containing protein [Pyrinomonadaceae bacterium]
MRRSFTLLCTLVCFAFFAATLLNPTNANAQKNKSSKAAAIAAKTKKNVKASDAKKDSKSAKSAKNDKKTDKKSAKSGAGNSAADKKSADSRKTADKNDRSSNAKNGKNDKRKLTAAEREVQRRADLERRRQAAIEAERRAAAARAAAEAARRREQARREAIARQMAFERGLRTETVANIAADDTTGEDLQIRQAAINALGNKAGTVVVMDAQNGQIVTMVNQKWAMGQGYKPCSTIKLLTGTAGINEGVINQSGNVTYHPQRIELTDAIAFSNNGYFQNVGGAVGFPKMMSYAREYGLGTPTGINAPNEAAGKIPESKTGFAVNHMSSHGDDFEITPLQLATVVSSITNGGKLLTPQIARTQKEADALRPKVRRNLNISQSTFQALMPGMMGAVNYGTARRAGDPTLNIGGKTGSCIGQGSWLGLFASVAPIASPKYAVVVITRGQQERGKWAAAVAGQVYQALAPKIHALQPLLAGAPQPVAPRPKIDLKTATVLSDEEDEASETAGETTNIVQNSPADTVKLVKPTVLMRPVGQPNTINTPHTKKGEYTSRPSDLIAPNVQSTPVPQPIKNRPRVVPQ